MSDEPQNQSLELSDRAVPIETPTLPEIARRSLGELFGEARAIKLTVLALIVLAIASDWASADVHGFLNRHSMFTTFLADALTLVVAYVLIDSFISARRELRMRPVMIPAARRMVQQADRPGRLLVKEINVARRADGLPTLAWTRTVGPRQEIDARRVERREYCVANAAPMLARSEAGFEEKLSAARDRLEQLVDSWAPLAAASGEFQYVIETAWNARSSIVLLKESIRAAQNGSKNEAALLSRLNTYLDRRDELSDALRNLDPYDGFRIDPKVRSARSRLRRGRADRALAT